ncbi:lysophospholipase [bacterium]|nr:lysophospholipase [bacterium]
MLDKHFKFKSWDNKEIYVHSWFPDSQRPIRGILALFHGIGEHAGRYQHVAEALTCEGYAVYAPDLRGHGQTAGLSGQLGHFGDHGAWQLMLHDMNELIILISSEYPNVPLFLMGHSMGSFLVRHFIAQFQPTLNGVILSGTRGRDFIMVWCAFMMTSFLSIFKCGKEKSPFVAKLINLQHIKPFQPARTSRDWLSRDNTGVDKFLDDPFFVPIFSLESYRQLFKGILYISRWHSFKNAQKVPMLIFSGDNDPVGRMGKGPIETYNSYKKAGLKEIELILYPQGRHEMLNELNKTEVIKRLLEWLNRQLD